MAPHVLCGEFEEFSSLIEKKKKDQFFVSALQYQHNDYHPQQKLGSAFWWSSLMKFGMNTIKWWHYHDML